MRHVMYKIDDEITPVLPKTLQLLEKDAEYGDIRSLY